MLPVGGVEDKQELITLGVTGCLVPRPLVQAVLLLLLIFTKIFVSDTLRFFNASSRLEGHRCHERTLYQLLCPTGWAVLLLLWKSPVPIYTQISNIDIPHICQAVTIGNTFTSWKWPQKQNMCEVVLCWPSGDCNNASLSVWFALPITQNMVIDQPPKNVFVDRYLYWFINTKFFLMCSSN